MEREPTAGVLIKSSGRLPSISPRGAVLRPGQGVGGWGPRPVPQAENAPMGERFPPGRKKFAFAGVRKPK